MYGREAGRFLQAQRRRAQSPLKNWCVLISIPRVLHLLTRSFYFAAWNTEGLHTPTKPYTLLDFEDEGAVAGCKTMADRAVGGFSTASLDYVPEDPSSNTPSHARFHGSISTKLPNNWRVERTGTRFFCVWWTVVGTGIVDNVVIEQDTRHSGTRTGVSGFLVACTGMLTHTHTSHSVSSPMVDAIP